MIDHEKQPDPFIVTIKNSLPLRRKELRTYEKNRYPKLYNRFPKGSK